MADNKNLSSHKIRVGFREKEQANRNKNEKTALDNSSVEKAGLTREKEKSFAPVEAIEQKSADKIAVTVAPPADGFGYLSPVEIKMRQRQARIEDILAEGLEDIYIKMPPAKQQEFKAAGEKTARKINLLLTEAKFKVSQIINLIKKWLSLIPGVNKYFLEQEAKIKTDEILKIKEED